MSDFVLSDDPALLDVERIHGWLASSYWSPGIARETVERAMAESHSLGAFRDGVQIGFARMVTDHTTFAWLADVFVDEAARGQGIGRAMVSWFVEHPRFASIRRFALVTKDAHGVYAGVGFHALLKPERYMERLSPEFTAILRGQS
jgi:GNAT superfamily N-acetyltransferase